MVSESSVSPVGPEGRGFVVHPPTRQVRTISSTSLQRLGLACFVLAFSACSYDYTSEDSTPSVQAATATGLSVSLTYQSDWKAGYCSTVSITNTGSSPISNWQVVINLGQARLAQLWKGTSTFTGQRMIVTPESENGQVSAGATASFGFCANAAGPNYHPILVSVTSNQPPSGKG